MVKKETIRWTTAMLVCSVLLAVASPVLAGPGEIKYVFTRTNTNYPVSLWSGAGGASWANTSTGQGAKPVGAPSGSVYASTPVGRKGDIKPVLDTMGGTYKLEYTMNNAGNNISQQLKGVSITQTDCTGLPATTDVFSASVTDRTWQTIGIFTLAPDKNTCTILFDYAGCTYTSGRANMDAWRITYYEPCMDTAPVGKFDGPIVPGDTSVKVTGCSTSANLVKVYLLDPNPANNILLGTAPGGTATVTVPVSPALAAGNVIGATQVIGTQEGCVPGYAVGFTLGFANGSLKMTMSLVDKAGLPGPLGAQGTVTQPYQLELVGVTSYIGAAPQGKELIPGGCWQTVTFKATDPGIDPMGATGLYSLGNGVMNNLPWAIIDGIQVAIDDDSPQTGPYVLYIDGIENGDRGKLTGFEAADETTPLTVGTTRALFGLPNAGSQTAEVLLANPNICEVTDEMAYEGTQSLKLYWQFRDLSTTNYVRFVTGSATSYKSPMVDVTQPITLHVMLLTAGSTPGNKPTITDQPADVVGVCPTDAASFTVVATVPAPDVIGYQWQKSTDSGSTWADIAGETAATYAFTTAADEDALRYRCVVTDTTSTCTATTRVARVVQSPQITAHPVPAHACSSETATFSVTATAPVGFTLTYQWMENGGNMSNTGGVSGATTATLTVPASGRNGSIFSCAVSTACATPKTTTSDAAILTVQGTPTLVASTSGSVTLGTAVTLDVGAFSGLYYTADTAVPTTVPIGTPVVNRIDPVVDFNWGTGTPSESPTVGIQTCTTATPPVCDWDHFMVRWQAKVMPPVSGAYTFYTRSDDGARLWVNDDLVIDSFVTQGATERSSVALYPSGYTLTAGTAATIRMEYFEHTGAAVAQLYWSPPGLPAKTDVSYVTWKKNGVTIPNATGARYGIASFATSNVGRYTAETVDPCTGSTLSFGPVELFVSADFDNSGKVDAVDVANFILCATNPDVPYVSPLTSPCVETMDQDGDGDIDTDDFGSVQAQFAP